MLIGLAIRDLVLIERLDLSFGPGLTALTGETGAGKSIILDALGLTTGARSEAGLVRRGVAQASATAIFAPPPQHPVWDCLEARELNFARDEDLVLRRTAGADGRSRAYVNDQAVSLGVLRELGALLVEVHGQHDTVGLLDAKTHRPALDAFGGCERAVAACGLAWRAWRAAAEAAERLEAERAETENTRAELAERLAELDRLAPREGEEAALAEERALLGAAEKTLGDIAQAREHLAGDSVSGRLAQAFRALERARERAAQAGVDPHSGAARLIRAAADATDRALIEAAEAAAATDAAAEAFAFEPDRLEKAEERLFALRAAARRLGVAVEALPATRITLAQRLVAAEGADEAVTAARARATRAAAEYDAAAERLTAARRAAGEALGRAVQGELGPLKLDKARFRVAVEPAGPERAGPAGVDRVEFQIATLPGAPFAALGSIASGGELARLALALKAALAGRSGAGQPLMIFDEVDQGVGGAVADAVGARLKRLAARAQVLVVTHSPQVAARADAHWRVRKLGDGEALRTAVDTLIGPAREEEIARMLSGARVTDAARAAARALMHA